MLLRKGVLQGKVFMFDFLTHIKSLSSGPRALELTNSKSTPRLSITIFEWHVTPSCTHSVRTLTMPLILVQKGKRISRSICHCFCYKAMGCSSNTKAIVMFLQKQSFSYPNTLIQE